MQEGARPIDLDVLDAEDAAALLARHLGDDRIAGDPEAVAELVEHCARLPLALSIVAARAALNPCLPLRLLAEDLRDERIRLDALDAGDPTASVRTVFSWSYQHLGVLAARIFRLLGIHPGPDISLSATASLAGVSLRQARTALAELARTHLITQNRAGRYAFHDLLRSYASEQADVLEAEGDRRLALRRMLDHYLHTARNAAVRGYPRRDPIALFSPESGIAPEEPIDCMAAWVWFEAEYATLHATLRLAADLKDDYAWQLPWLLAEFFERRGHWQDWLETMRIGLAVAEHRNNARGSGLDPF